MPEFKDPRLQIQQGFISYANSTISGSLIIATGSIIFPDQTTQSSAPAAGGSGTPGGSSGQIQYNNGGNFGGVPTLTYTGGLLKATGSFTGSFKGDGSGLTGISGGSTNTGSLLLTASVSLNTITFTKGDGSTFPIIVDTGSGGGGTTNTGSLLLTASVLLNTITFTKGDGTTFPITVNTGSGGATINTGSFVTTSSFNSFTASIYTFTSSYSTGSFTGSFTGSLFGTASFASTASLALNSVTTASVSLNTITFTKGDTSTFSLTVNTGSGGGSGAGFPFSGSAVITGSLLISGSGVTITGSLNVTGPIIVPFNIQSTNYTLQLADAGDIVEINSGSANTVTIPSSSVTNFTIGTQITVVQYGTGQTTFTTGSTNVLLRSAGNATKLAAQYAGATLIKRGTDEWYLLGNVTV